MLTASGVGYRLPTGRVLFEDVTLQLVPGEAVAVEGPSGTGKSTLLAVIGGVLPATHGQIGIDTDRPAPFAWVLQTLNSLGARTVLANAALLARLDGMPSKQASERARANLDLVGIGDLADAKARQLSGGELQRLAVARALTSTRPIVLADEPTNQLDRHNARRVMQALVDSAAIEHRCVLIVTHDHDALPDTATVLRLAEDGLHAT